jgi:hypothetical protein
MVYLPMMLYDVSLERYAANPGVGTGSTPALSKELLRLTAPFSF